MRGKTKLFSKEHYAKCKDLQCFCALRGIQITIFTDYVTVSKLDSQPTEFIQLEYPVEIESVLLIDYFVETNQIKFIA